MLNLLFYVFCVIIDNNKKGVFLLATKLQKMKWDLYCFKERFLLIWGLKNGLIMPYDDELIEKLRTIYYGGIPASVLLLSNSMTNGNCYERALLMSGAFLEDEGDVQLLYAAVDSLKLNPKFICNDPLYSDHCIVERVTKEGRHLIYDASTGFIYDKKLYWLMENPKVRKVNDKEVICNFIQDEEYYHPEDIENDKYAAPLILSIIETTFGRPNEMYSTPSIELLQREIEYYKNKINYDAIVEEIDQDMRRLGLKR